MATKVEYPEWLVPGAEVVVFTVGGRGAGLGTPDAHRTTIARVATQSFTITGSADRFRLGTQEHYRRSAFSGVTRRVVPVDSAEGQRELAKVARMHLEWSARAACDQWARNKSGENRLAAIAALQAIPDEA